MAANRYWIASSTANWNSTANWSTTSGGSSGASVPGSSDKAIFNGGGTGNCTINANASVLHIDVRNNYTGTITQSSTYTITVASNGSASFSGGTFTGGSGDFTVAGTFTLDSNALFTSTSATLAIRDAVTIDDGDDFTHNSGLFSLTSLSAGSTVNVDMDTIILYDFKVNDAAGLKNITFASDNEITVNNNFTLTGSTSSYEIFLFGGKIFCKKNIYVSYRWSNTVGQGTTEVIVDGSGTQIIDGTGNLNGALFKLTINKGTDTLKFKGPINIHNNLTNTSGILVFESTSAITMKYPSTIDGNFDFDKLTFEAVAGTYADTWNINDTLTTSDDLVFKGNKIVYLLGGIIYCNEDFDISTNTSTNASSTSLSNIGTTEIQFSSNQNQSWVGRSSSSLTWLPIIVINKSGGTLTLSGNSTIGNRFHYKQGTLDPGSAILSFVKNADITGNDFSLSNVKLQGYSGVNAVIDVNDSTLLTINNTLYLTNATAYFSNGTVNCKGDIIITTAFIPIYNGSLIIINGTGDQILDGAVGTGDGTLGNVLIDKSSGTLYFKDYINVTGNFEYKNGTLDYSTYSNTINFLLDLNPKISGTFNISNLRLNRPSTGGTKTFTVKNTSTITVNGNFTTSGTAAFVLDSGTIEVKGNIVVTSGLNGGISTIKAIGTNAQTFTGTTAITTGELPKFTINKSGGTFTVTNIMNVQKSLTLTNGIIKTANGSSKVYLFGTSSVSGGSKTSYVDGIVGKYGNTAITFPVGENGLYRPLTMTSPTSASAQYEVEYFATGQTLGSTIDTSFSEISNTEYWKFDRVAQTNNVKATLAWSENKSEIPGDSSTLASLYWNSGTSKWVGLTNDLLTGNATIGSLRTPTLTTYSYLILGKKKKNEYYVSTQHKLDGGVYQTKSNRLYVKYIGEYNLSELRFNIYDMNNDIVADQTDAGVVDKFYQNTGDNRLIFNFSSGGVPISTGYYILEIMNDKNEKEYLRFKKP